MIYLLQDCYKDRDNSYHDILKIGYSKDSFDSSRKSMYNTHNFGYKFLGEKKGSQWLETFLHKKFSGYRLSSGEWFEYSEEIIKEFWEISEEDISDFKDQEKLNEFIKEYILDNLVPNVNKLLSLYLEKILGELKEKDLNYEENKNLYRKEILDVFNFVSSKEKEYFENLDFTSQENIKILENHNLIISKSKKKDISLLENIVPFYKTIRKNKVITEENFINLQNRRRNSTANLLNVFNKCSRDEKVDYIQKLRSDIQVSKYTRDFVSISEKTGAPVHNEFIELAYERAYEISQKDYQDKITVTKSIENAKFEGKIEVDESSKRIVHEFIQKYFDNVSWFNDKLRLYCEFCDYYSSNIPVLVYFYSIIEDSDVYQRYYEHYGTSGCKAREYVKKRLDEGMRDNSKEDVLASELEKIFKPGDILLLRDIKSTLAKIYEKIGITSTPKASILGNYFDLKDKRIVDKSTGKQSKGYEILGTRKAG